MRLAVRARSSERQEIVKVSASCTDDLCVNRPHRCILAAGIAVLCATLVDATNASAHSTSLSVASTSTYLVKEGDTLDGISRKLRLSMHDLLQANNLTVKSVIRPGDSLNIPASVVAASLLPTTALPVYVVRRGDALAGIAIEHGVTLGALLKANNLTAKSAIHPGQTLQLPPATRTIHIARPPAAATPSPSDPPHPQATPTEILLTYLMDQVGKPYKFFTAGPDTFDCSGLVVAGYRQIGIALPHQSAALSSRGASVDWLATPVKAGDLIFMLSSGDSGQIGHVGIALNSTTWIQAVGTGVPVRVRPLPADTKIAAVRRILP